MILIASNNDAYDKGSCTLVRYPPLDTPGLCKPTYLQSADVCFEGNGPNGKIDIAIEIKRPSDVVDSLQSGRLQSDVREGGQIATMTANYDVNWLLIYGAYRPSERDTLEIWNKGQWYPYPPTNNPKPYSYHEGYLVSPSFTGTNCRAWRVFSIQEAAKWIYIVYRCWQKPWSEHKSNHAHNKSANTLVLPPREYLSDPVYYAALMARTLPGIGDEKALAVAEYFGSAARMCNASVDEWAKVVTVSSKGRETRIGETRAKIVVGVLAAGGAGKTGADRDKAIRTVQTAKATKPKSKAI